MRAAAGHMCATLPQRRPAPRSHARAHGLARAQRLAPDGARLWGRRGPRSGSRKLADALTGRAERKPEVDAPVSASNGRSGDNGARSEDDARGRSVEVGEDGGADRPQASAGGSQGEGQDQKQRPPWVRAVQSVAGAVGAALAAVFRVLPTPLQNVIAAIMVRIYPFMPLLAVFGLSVVSSRRGRDAPRPVMYSKFIDLVDAGCVKQATLETSQTRVFFTLRPEVREALESYGVTTLAEVDTAVTDKLPGNKNAKVTPLKTKGKKAPKAAAVEPVAPEAAATKKPSKLPNRWYALRVPDGTLVQRLQTAGVEYGAVSPTMGQSISRVLMTALALWIPLLPMLFLFQRFLRNQSGGARKSNRRASGNSREPRVTFADVAGVGPAKEELMEVVNCLRDSKRYAKLNARTPSGVLLAGPPGTGKTLLAKAVAGEAGVPFFSASASEFVEMYVGRGAARIRELFAEARKRAPSVVFIDELDAVGARRGIGFNEERDQTLNQLLTELDGFEGRQGVVLLAATNRPEVLDSALLRPGRLTRRVNVPLPDLQGRKDILEVHLKRVPVRGTERKDLADVLSRITNGLSGADLENVVNEGALLAGRRGGDAVGLEDLLDGLQRTRYGVGGVAGGPVGQQFLRWMAGLSGEGSVSARNAT